MSITRQATLMVGSMLLATAPAAAQDGARDPIRVAVMDVNADQIDFKDPNVDFVRLTPTPPKGSTFAQAEAGLAQHGVIVASAFVEEYRRIDQNRRITIYTLNPFIRRDGENAMRFRMQTLRDAIPKIKQAGVRIVVSAFSVSDKEAGDRIAKEFSDNGLILFAASPNQPKEDSIYPAASPGVIAIAEPMRGGPLESDPRYKKFVDFVISGEYGKGNGHVSGTSFASGRAAAYAAHLVDLRPDATIEDVKTSFRENGQIQIMSFKKAVRLGDRSMLDAFRAMRPAQDMVSMAKSPGSTQVASVSIPSRMGEGR